MKSPIHFQTSTVQPLRFGNGYVISPTLYYGSNYISMLGSKLNRVGKRAPSDGELKISWVKTSEFWDYITWLWSAAPVRPSARLPINIKSKLPLCRPQYHMHLNHDRKFNCRYCSMDRLLLSAVFHWNGNGRIFTKFTSLAARQIVKMTVGMQRHFLPKPSTRYKHHGLMVTIPFVHAYGIQCYRCDGTNTTMTNKSNWWPQPLSNIPSNL